MVSNQRDMSLTQKRNAMKIHLRAQMDDILMRLKELDEQSAEAANCSWNSIYQKIDTNYKNQTALIICNKITEQLVKKYNDEINKAQTLLAKNKVLLEKTKKNKLVEEPVPVKKPQPPPTPERCFIQKCLRKVQQKNPNDTKEDVIKKLRDIWKSMNDEEKIPFQDMSVKIMKKRYKMENEEYLKTLTKQPEIKTPNTKNNNNKKEKNHVSNSRPSPKEYQMKYFKNGEQFKQKMRKKTIKGVEVINDIGDMVVEYSLKDNNFKLIEPKHLKKEFDTLNKATEYNYELCTGKTMEEIDKIFIVNAMNNGKKFRKGSNTSTYGTYKQCGWTTMDGDIIGERHISEAKQF